MPKRLTELRPSGSEEEFTADAHAACPGHAAIVSISWISERQSAATEANEDLLGRDQDDDSYDDEDYDEDGDLVSPHSGHYGPIGHLCVHRRRQVRPPAALGKITRKAAEMAPEEGEQARADRNDVIPSNKDWRSAETVPPQVADRVRDPDQGARRRRGLHRKLPHRCRSPDQQRAVHGQHFGARGVRDPGGGPSEYANRTTPITDLVAGALPAPATVITLGVLLSAYESVTSVQSCRHLSDSTARYLRFIESAGYTLSEVELRACGAVIAKAALA